MSAPRLSGFRRVASCFRLKSSPAPSVPHALEGQFRFKRLPLVSHTQTLTNADARAGRARGSGSRFAGPASRRAIDSARAWREPRCRSLCARKRPASAPPVLASDQTTDQTTDHPPPSPATDGADTTASWLESMFRFPRSLLSDSVTLPGARCGTHARRQAS